MPKPSPSEITRILKRARTEEESALVELVPHVYDELKELAASYLNRERAGHTLQPTALVHEAFARLANAEEVQWADRVHFFAAAARVMRRVLVDHARRDAAVKRGGAGQRITLHDEHATDVEDPLDVLDLHAALEELAELHERKARVVELRFFGGLTFSEAGHVLGVSPRTVEKDWYLARAWLRRELGRAAG